MHLFSFKYCSHSPKNRNPERDNDVMKGEEERNSEQTKMRRKEDEKSEKENMWCGKLVYNWSIKN